MTDKTIELLNPLKLYAKPDQVRPVCSKIPLDVPNPRFSLFEKVYFSPEEFAVVTGMEYVSPLVAAVGYERTLQPGWHYCVSYEDGCIDYQWFEDDLLREIERSNQKHNDRESVLVPLIAS